MTREEAIKQMHRGEKITHRYFSSDEWMTIEKGMFLLEDGVKVPFELFWKDRQGEGWEDGYEYYG